VCVCVCVGGALLLGKARCGVGAPQRALATFKSTGRSEEVRVTKKRVYRTDFPYSP
jgi:hypothetical protein